MSNLLERMKAWGGRTEFHRPTTADDGYEFLSQQVQENHRAGGASKSLGKREVAATISRSEGAQVTLVAIDAHDQAHQQFDYFGVTSACTLRELDAKRALPDNIFSAEDVRKLEDRGVTFDSKRNTAWNEVEQTNEALPEGLREDHERPGLPVEGEC